MSAIEEGFWQDILAHPEDDAARLIYADWLDDNDDIDMAEFIRAQIAVESLAEDNPHHWILWRRANDLLALHRSSWNAGVKELALAETFRRGFIDEVTIRAEDFLHQIGPIMDEAPVRRLTLTGRPVSGEVVEGELLTRIARSPHLDRLIGLRLQIPIALAGAEALAYSPNLGGLRELYLESHRITAAALRALLRAPWAQQLRSLQVSWFYDADPADALASVADLSRLE